MAQEKYLVCSNTSINDVAGEKVVTSYLNPSALWSVHISYANSFTKVEADAIVKKLQGLNPNGCFWADPII